MRCMRMCALPWGANASLLNHVPESSTEGPRGNQFWDEVKTVLRTVSISFGYASEFTCNTAIPRKPKYSEYKWGHRTSWRVLSWGWVISGVSQVLPTDLTTQAPTIWTTGCLPIVSPPPRIASHPDRGNVCALKVILLNRLTPKHIFDLSFVRVVVISSYTVYTELWDEFFCQI